MKRLLRLPQIVSKTGLCRTTVYQLMSEGAFPRPVNLYGTIVAWVESEVDEWIDRHIARRDAEFTAGKSSASQDRKRQS